MPHKKLNILADQRMLRKFCERRDKDYHCANIFGCEIACPLAHLDEIQYQINLKNLPFGEAYRLAERRTITEEEGKKIVQDKMKEAEDVLKEKKKDGNSDRAA